jgi:ERCC4-type nuclease
MTASIFVTDKPNDRDLATLLGSMAAVIPIPHGDCCWFGITENPDQPSRNLLERKKLGDMANSIIYGRYLYQAQCAKEAGFTELNLAVEGRFRIGADGFLEVPGFNRYTLKRGWKQLIPAITYSRWAQYLYELTRLVGITVCRTENVHETAELVKALWLNSQKAPTEHGSLKQIYSSPAPTVQLVKPSLVRRVASELPGIGWERSGEADRRFHSVQELANADERDWEGIPGVGKRTAQKVVAAIRNMSGG